MNCFMYVLTGNWAIYQTQSDLATSESRLASDLVALYKALGGGWQTEAIVSDVDEKPEWMMPR
jgi:multidrug efflux system outer membrane protein